MSRTESALVFSFSSTRAIDPPATRFHGSDLIVEPVCSLSREAYPDNFDSQAQTAMGEEDACLSGRVIIDDAHVFEPRLKGALGTRAR